MPTPLESLLDDGQKRQLVNYLHQRIQSVETSLTNYRDKRKRFEAQMNDDFEWRRGGRQRGSYNQAGLDDWANSIFDLQNDSVNVVGGFAAFMSARTVDDVFGTDPYYALTPEGLADDILAQSMQKHSEWKLRKSNWKDAGLDAIDCAIGIGEGVIKSYWCREVDVFETRKTVLIDVPSKKPVVTVDGDYVFQDDVQISQGRDASGQVVPVMLVKKDPSLALNVNHLAWNEMEIEQTNISFNNVKSHVMHYGDILVPENEASFDDSSFVGHRFQRRLSYLRAHYDLSPDLLAILQTGTTEAKSEEAKPIETLQETGEHEPQQDIPDPTIEIVECWVRYDPVGDGRQRRMYILYARQDMQIISMDYIANVTPEGALPFEVVRAFKVKNRWYGRGYYEIYEKAQEFVDRHLNYVAYRNRFHSNPAKFLDVSLLLEDEESDDEFILEPGKTMRKKAGVKSEDVLSFVEFPDLDERTWQLMQFQIQMIQVRSGVTSAAQGEVSSLPSTATATGVESILQSASTLARMPMGTIKSGLERSLLYSIKLIYANMDDNEIYTYFEGDQQKIGTLEAEKVKDLDMNVRLLLTRFKQREQVEEAQKAIDIMSAYIQLPESEKGPVRPLYLQIIKGLGFDQADTIVRPPIPQTGGGSAIPRENLNVNIKFEMLPFDIQQQFYPLMGLNPSQLPPPPQAPAKQPGAGAPGQPQPPGAQPPPPDVQPSPPAEQ